MPKTKQRYPFQTTHQRSTLMSRIKSKNTSPEVLLRRLLWHNGFRYRISNGSLYGSPDIVFKAKKVVIFIDGEFWHGYNWNIKKTRIKANSAFWIKKIEGNMARDKKVNEYYESEGWKVIRFWASQVKKEPVNCLEKIRLTFLDV